MNYLSSLTQLIIVVSIVYLSSCETKEKDEIIPDKPIITLEDTGNQMYQKNDQARFIISASIPGGLKTLNYTKTVDGVESTPTLLTIASEDATSIRAVPFEIAVIEAEGKTVTITVKVTDKSDQIATAITSYTVTSLPALPTITLQDLGNGEYQQGSKANYAINASIPGGLKTLSYTKTVDGNESSVTNLSTANSGDTQINSRNLSIDVSEEVGKKVTIKVSIVDKNDQTSAAELTYTVISSKPNPPTLSVSEGGNGSYERGDEINYNITGKIHGGFKTLTYSKVVDGIESATTVISGINVVDTNLNGNLKVLVTEDVGKQVTVKFQLIDQSDQSVTANATYTVTPTGQGGGGAVPLVSGMSTVTLGTESSLLGGFLATSKGASGVFKSSVALTNQADIDVTLGVGTTGGPSLISPDNRTSVGLDAGNPAMTNPRATFFKLEPNGPTDLSVVRALEVENNISGSSTKNVQLEAGKTYSFFQGNSTGKKGYIRVTSITGTGTNRTVTLEFIVQL